MTTILGAGFTGLAAAMASGGTVYEAADDPGGICASYYCAPGDAVRSATPPADEEAYRFELGGGHWIFGGDPAVLTRLGALAPMRSYTRRASVRLRERAVMVDYPFQMATASLPRDLAARVAADRVHLGDGTTADTMQAWLADRFGPTMCELFFFPFHERYTAGLYQSVAPQDGYKTPPDRAGLGAERGYNATFRYPIDGLSALARRMADQCDVRYGKRVVSIDTKAAMLGFADGTEVGYTGRLISTLPLHEMLALTGEAVAASPDPYTSVLVLNIGAGRGPRCGSSHWVYEPESTSGFHRIGCYSNVDSSFLPASARATGDRVGIYVERAYRGGDRPSDAAIANYVDDAVRELQNLGVIETVEVCDPTWIDVAYTWSWPGSTWREVALDALTRAGVEQVGRYGRWNFQGIADSVRDGLAHGERPANA